MKLRLGFFALVLVSYLITPRAFCGKDLIDGIASLSTHEAQRGDVAELIAKIGPRVIVLMGAPGSGKGTQGVALSKVLGMPHISTGDLMRAEVKSGSDRGKELESYLKAGAFAPHTLTDEIIFDRLAQDDCKDGFILDGYPRTRDQVGDLDVILSRLHRQVDTVIYLQIRDEVLLDRLSGRQICSRCGASYHRIFVPPREESKCDSCGGELVSRSDDSEEVTRKRLATFHSETEPLVQFYFKKDRLYTLSAALPPDELTHDIIQTLAASSEGALVEKSPYDCLSRELEQLRLLGGSPSALDEVVRKFRDQSLQQNHAKRTGQVRRWVYAMTGNQKKYQELVNFFDVYGIEVLQVPVVADPGLVQSLLRSGESGLVPLAVIREESQLVKPGTLLPSSMRDGVDVENLSVLRVHQLRQGHVETKEYVNRTQGTIDLSRRVPSDREVFGWDDIFMVQGVGRTFHELKAHGMKVASRQTDLAEFLKDAIYYKKPRDLQHSPQHAERTIDFRIDPADFVKGQGLLNLPLTREYGYQNLIETVLNQGLYFRSPENRRLSNVWEPNVAGLPLVPKADPMHELTFMMHDFGHFTIPDLIFTGNDSPDHRKAYILYRMISEASTMVLADMFFVDALRKSGIEYDYTKRKIYPVLLETGIDFSNPDSRVGNLKRLIRANAAYLMRGDDSLYREMIRANGGKLEVLEDFKKKYKPFFVEDFRWTERNYDQMTQNSDAVRRWWKQVEPLRIGYGLRFESIDDFLVALRASRPSETRSELEWVDQIFEFTFERNLRPIFEGGVELRSQTERLRNAFVRYMTGQMGIFAKFPFVMETEMVRQNLMGQIEEAARSISQEKIAQIRTQYEDFLKMLVERHLITADDFQTYREIYPLFDAFYVSYDKDTEYEDLGAVFNRVMATETHRHKQVEAMEKTIKRKLTSKESRSLKQMISLIETGGGTVDQGIFVSRPGVTLLSRSEFNLDAVPPETARILGDPTVLAESIAATFLLSGVSVETSMELIAHSEANVARLTTSKTAAMNVPLFRVQGDHPESQKDYLKKILSHRSDFEYVSQPRRDWEAGTELFNMTQAGNKVTALTYTMSLRDYHKLFIGRMGSAGNEREVREVARAMCTELHARYPEIIRTPEEYEAMGNGAKYQGIKTHHPESFERSLLHGELSRLGASVVGETRITPEARRIFEHLNIDSTASETNQLAEFRSRLTYLAFEDQKSSSKEYLHRMVHELEHLSITSASVFNVIVSGVTSVFAQELRVKAAQLGGTAVILQQDGALDQSVVLINLNSKSYLKLIRDLNRSGKEHSEMRQTAASIAEHLAAATEWLLPTFSGDVTAR